MTNILQTLAIAATLITVTVAASSSALAGADSLYPAQFRIKSSLSVRQCGKRDTGPIPAGRVSTWEVSAQVCLRLGA